jgi:hypothetical protein
MSRIKHNIADALRGRGDRFTPLSKVGGLYNLSTQSV